MGRGRHPSPHEIRQRPQLSMSHAEVGSEHSPSETFLLDAVNKGMLWVAAHAHRRTVGLCEAWNVPLIVLRPGRKGLLVWALRIWDILRVISKRRPRIVFVANPSLVLTTFACLARRIFGFIVIVDAHNEGVRPFDRRGALVTLLTTWLLRNADATIVTNADLEGDVRAAGGRPFVLPDRLPRPPDNLPAGPGAGSESLVVVIATFRRDEPIDAIVAAARSLPNVRFVFTGDPGRLGARRAALPSNVSLPGFLPEPSYWALLAEAGIVCDLTLKKNCLVCGAYEALILGKAMVLSDDDSTRRVFGRAAILTRPVAKEIAAAVQLALRTRKNLEAASELLREEYIASWQSAGDRVLAEIRSISGQAVTSASNVA